MRAPTASDRLSTTLRHAFPRPAISSDDQAFARLLGQLDGIDVLGSAIN